ncbi:uncharacterized protein LOC134534458 [Bacillus rossius redtenbacheri]|uniref:uncharacterized protein LOC134534458 n=1 Tax=Bacillus rossius redtenbacheri TaxID=93214 RepID=UPI002FDD3037
MSAAACLLLLLVVCMGSAQAARSRRFFWPFSGLFGGGPDCGGGGDCPPHHCRLDSAVIHGYCCGCAKLTDRVPIACPPSLQCPLSPQPLCSDYDYMMDCCC